MIFQLGPSSLCNRASAGELASFGVGINFAHSSGFLHSGRAPKYNSVSCNVKFPLSIKRSWISIDSALGLVITKVEPMHSRTGNLLIAIESVSKELDEGSELGCTRISRQLLHRTLVLQHNS
ncbi:hypothetical protein KL905_003494 [Ogataea polymorpha]|uniref:Uncharacterized protein n=1 Tax=Ogataea polymorpha TaxID=460523 RepID=A0A9P8NUN8_9ASCO|nr:hypothetical protein KL937_003524 [Ogataea polymorpha]KAG7899430.1 hypothetical protein KL935_003740 [Ogataea polymorpha]KAG7919629.1 hypothetical protein KL905_003494 [Ogataea polymorpha]KAG7925772.1 hypothetical protein KL925_004182 [Ogataea polymorpha]KAG7932923.1 hypothetical protein KL934_003578 [Ogataea polymorpha]